MSATMDTVDAILKEVYGPRIVDQLQHEQVAIKRLEKSSDGITETVGGKYVNFPLKVGRNHGQGYRNENELLPAAKRQKYAEIMTKLKYGYGRVRLTGQLMTLAEKNHQAFASGMDREMDGIKEDLSKDTNRIAWGDSTGLLGMITDTATSATHTVNNTALFEVGMQVDVLTASSGATVQLDTDVVAVDEDAGEVEFGDSFTGAATAGVYRQGSFEKEPNGLGSIIGTTNEIYGADPATIPIWKSIIDDNGGTPRALSESLMIETVDKVRQNGGKTSVILTSLGVRRAYFNLLTQQRRFTDTKEFSGGFKGLPFNYDTEIPVVEDPEAPKNQMSFLEEKEIKIYQSKDWHWADDDGDTLKWVTGYDAFEAVMRKYWEIGCSRRNTQARVEDITEG